MSGARSFRRVFYRGSVAERKAARQPRVNGFNRHIGVIDSAMP